MSTTQKVLNDLSQNFGNDLSASSTGDLQLASGSDLSNQRILRRLLTAINAYIWDVSYGAGLPAYIGQPLSAQTKENLISTINSQIFLEDTVAKNPMPVIFLNQIEQGIFCQINYVYAPTKTPIVLSFNV